MTIDGGVMIGEEYKEQCMTRMKSGFKRSLKAKWNGIDVIRECNQVSSEN
jgi:hypothetical protein